MKDIKCCAGVTIIELATTVILVSILSFAGFAVYNNHEFKIKAAEGLVLLNLIKERQELSYDFSDATGTGGFKNTGGTVVSVFTFDDAITPTSASDKFIVDARNNKYFTSFKIIQESDGGYTAEAYYEQASGKVVVAKLTAHPSAEYEVLVEKRTSI